MKKLTVLLASCTAAAALVATAATPRVGWKWGNNNTVQAGWKWHAQQQHQVAGWSWDLARGSSFD